MKPVHNWTPSLSVVLGLLPLIMALGAWALSNSNRVAVMENEVSTLQVAHEDDEKRIEKLEIQVAGRCR